MRDRNLLSEFVERQKKISAGIPDWMFEKPAVKSDRQTEPKEQKRDK